MGDGIGFLQRMIAGRGDPLRKGSLDGIEGFASIGAAGKIGLPRAVAARAPDQTSDLEIEAAPVPVMDGRLSPDRFRIGGGRPGNERFRSAREARLEPAEEPFTAFLLKESIFHDIRNECNSSATKSPSHEVYRLFD
jgi:hypothetical protein